MITFLILSDRNRKPPAHAFQARFADHFHLPCLTFSLVHLPLSFSDSHKQILVLYRDPACQSLHRVFKVRAHQDVSHAVDQSRRRRMQDVQGCTKMHRILRCGRSSRLLIVPEEHEYIPDPQLGRKRDRVVEQGEIPAGAIRCGCNT